MDVEPLAAHLESCETCADLVLSLRVEDTLAEEFHKRETIPDQTFEQDVESFVERFNKLPTNTQTILPKSDDVPTPTQDCTSPGASSNLRRS